MHHSAWLCGKAFFTILSVLLSKQDHVALIDISGAEALTDISRPLFTILEIGSRSFHGDTFNLRTAVEDTSLNETFQIKYIGMDMEAGVNVDVVIHPKDKYFPVPDDSIDVILSSSAFEHDARFWITFLKMLRALKPGGFLHLVMPYEWEEHRYPVDCWRFYSDSGSALYEWGVENGFSIHLLQSEKMPQFTLGGGLDMSIVIYKQRAGADNDDSLLKELNESFHTMYMSYYNSLNRDIFNLAKILKLSSSILPGSGGLTFSFAADDGTIRHALISEEYEVSFT